MPTQYNICLVFLYAFPSCVQDDVKYGRWYPSSCAFGWALMKSDEYRHLRRISNNKYLKSGHRVRQQSHHNDSVGLLSCPNIAAGRRVSWLTTLLFSGRKLNVQFWSTGTRKSRNWCFRAIPLRRFWQCGHYYTALCHYLNQYLHLKTFRYTPHHSCQCSFGFGTLRILTFREKEIFIIQFRKKTKRNYSSRVK